VAIPLILDGVSEAKFLKPEDAKKSTSGKCSDLKKGEKFLKKESRDTMCSCVKSTPHSGFKKGRRWR